MLLRQYYLEVHLEHLVLYNEDLAHAIQDTPGEIMPLVRVIWIYLCLFLIYTIQFETAATNAARNILFPGVKGGLDGGSEETAIPKIQVTDRKSVV